MLAGELHFFSGYKCKLENGRGKDPSSKTIPQIASEDYVQKIIFLHCYAFSIVKTAVNHSGFDFWNFILSKILLSSSQRKKKKAHILSQSETGTYRHHVLCHLLLDWSSRVSLDMEYLRPKIWISQNNVWKTDCFKCQNKGWERNVFPWTVIIVI